METQETLIERVLDNIKERREKVLKGGINSIPSPFKRFSNDFIGIEQGKYYVITSSSKGAKTQFMSYTFLFEPLLYAFKNKDKLRLKVFYYPLEETPEGVTRRFISYLLFKLDGLRYSSVKLLSSKEGEVLPEEVLQKLKENKYQELLKFFNESIIFSTARNPTGIYKEITSYAKDNGELIYKTIETVDEFGNKGTIRKFDHYIPKDPDLYTLIIVDHVSLLNSEKGKSTKDNIDMFSSDYMVEVRNRYNFTPVIIQQQSMDSESTDAIKLKRRPSQNTLGDSKYTGRDCNMLIGLFSPAKVNMSEFFGYNIARLKDNMRFMEIILNRDGIQGGGTALFFDGEVCNFEELPPASEAAELEKIYKYAENLRRQIHPLVLKAQTFFTFIINKFKTHE